jgi:hypothetical protein
VTIAIADAAGHEIRRFASDDVADPIDPEIEVPTYWVRPQRNPATGPGFHRFVWDLHEAAPLAFEHGYPISAIVHDTPRAPEGVLVLPGTYTVRLTAGGRTYSRPLTIVLDPRVTVSAAALHEQYALATQIVRAMNHAYELAGAAKTQQDTAAAARYGKLNGELARLLDFVEGADAAPTVTAEATVAKLLHGIALGGRIPLELRGEDEP